MNNTQITIPTGFRLLHTGEIILKGDYHTPISSIYDISKLANLANWYTVDDSIGHSYSTNTNGTLAPRFSYVIRKIDENNQDNTNNQETIDNCVENLKQALKHAGYSNIFINIKADKTKAEEFNHFIQ